jgi:hypothetical protein
LYKHDADGNVAARCLLKKWPMKKKRGKNLPRSKKDG